MHSSSSLLRLVLGAFTAILLAQQLAAAPKILPDEDPGERESFQLVWESTPGARYGVKSSNDLKIWNDVNGFPKFGTGAPLKVEFSGDAAPIFFHLTAFGAFEQMVHVEGGTAYTSMGYVTVASFEIGVTEVT